MKPHSRRKKPVNLTLSETARLGGEALAQLEGCSLSELVEALMRDALRAKGIERAFTQEEISAAVEQAQRKRKAK